MKVKE